jgi:hypothetical protein
MIKAKVLLRCAAFLVVLLLAVQALGWYFTPVSNENLYAYDSGGIYGENKNTIDVLVIGSSNASRDVTPMQWYQDYGMAAYTFGIGGGSVTEVYYALKKIYRTQSPKVVILCADTIYNTADGSTVQESTLSDVLEAKMPLFRYHNKWRELRPDTLVRNHDFTWRDYDKGYTPQTGCNPMDAQWFMSDQEPARKVPLLSDLYTRAIFHMCRAHGSEVMLATLPAKDWTMSNHLGITEYAAKHNVSYIDYNLPESGVTIDWSQDTYDFGFHLNYVGALKITNHLGGVVRSNYSVPDRRGAKGYELWPQELDRYQKEQIEQLKAMAATVPAAAKLLAEGKT